MKKIFNFVLNICFVLIYILISFKCFNILKFVILEVHVSKILEIKSKVIILSWSLFNVKLDFNYGIKYPIFCY
jgi:hypothetical protein